MRSSSEGRSAAQATYDITLEAWGADYNDPYDFLNILLDGSQIDSTGNNNYAYCNNPTFNKQMHRRGASRRLAPVVRPTRLSTRTS